MAIKVESDFMHNGLRCVVVMTPMGHRCGYVGIDDTHPLYKVNYDDESNYLVKENMKEINEKDAGLGLLLNAMMGAYEKEHLSPESYFSVHGGITYADNCSEYPIQSDLWWFGFDTAHCYDGKDLDKAYEYGLLTKEDYYRSKQFELEFSISGSIARSKDYCETECKSLAEQLSKIIKEEK